MIVSPILKPMDAKTSVEYEAILSELNLLTLRLETVRNRIATRHAGIGQEICAARLDLSLQRLYKARKALGCINTAKITEDYAAKHNLNY